MAALPGLELRCFGPPTALLGGRAAPSEVLWTKHLALLVYLALSPDRRRSREHLLGRFWGDSTQDRAKGALNETMRRLRKALGKGRLKTEGDAVELNGDGLVVDALRVTDDLERAPLEAAALLRGEFLEGLNVRKAQEFEEWVAGEQRRFRTLRLRALIAAAERSLVNGRAAAAADYAAQALDDQPHSETAASLLIQALALSGDTTAALERYHDFAARLERDIHERPSKTFTALAERIRRGSLRQGTTPHTPREAPLVGRAGAHREVFEALIDGLNTGPRAIVVTAAPGMGRTRLLSECVARALLSGAHVVRAQQLENDHDARWSVLRQLVRGGLADAPGLAGARPDALGVLASIVPELAGRFAPRPVDTIAEAGAALQAVIQAVADETPLVIAIDDAHWADAASIAALHAAIGRTSGGRIVTLLTLVPDVAAAPRELLRFQSDVGVGTPGVSVKLEPLLAQDMEESVKALAPWCTDEADRARRARWLLNETGGNPFLAVTLLGALEKASPQWRDNWPPPGYSDIVGAPVSVRAVYAAVQMRVRELSDADIAILKTAAIGGVALDLDLIEGLSGKSRADVEVVLHALERRHLVRYDGTRYVFTAPLILEAIRIACVTAGERRQLANRALQLLADRPDLEGRALRCELLARSEPSQEAMDYIVGTLQAARDSGAERLARRAWLAGDKLAAKGTVERRALDTLKPT